MEKGEKMKKKESKQNSITRKDLRIFVFVLLSLLSMGSGILSVFAGFNRLFTGRAL